jgi:RNA polymerase sigma-70 factor, ECF subfamily
VLSILSESVEATSASAVDVDVVRRAKRGNADAFEDLARAVSPSLVRFLRGRGLTASETEDALQEVLIAAWRSLPRLRRVDRFAPWVFGIAVHRASDVYRRRRSNDAVADDQLSIYGEPRMRIVELVGRLPVAQREVLLLRYLVGLSEAETAAALGVRVGTVKSRAARGAAALRIIIAEEVEEP